MIDLQKEYETKKMAEEAIKRVLKTLTTVPTGMLPEYALNQIADKILYELANNSPSLLICREEEIKE